MSPFLFILAMEGLSNLIHTTKMNRWIRGFRVDNNAQNGSEITHLQYADGTLIFCEAMTGQMSILRLICIIFEAVSGLHINWGKSSIYTITEVARVESLAGVLGGRVGELPTI